MNIVLWILQVLLAAFFLFHGWLYVVWPTAMAERMQQRNPTAKPLGLAPSFRRFIGVAEWLGAAGVILPGLTSILPWLTPLAAAGLMIVTVSAVVFHLSRRDIQGVIFAGIWFVLAAFVAYMCWLVLRL